MAATARASKYTDVLTVRISRCDSTTKLRQLVMVPATMMGRNVMRMLERVRWSQTWSAVGVDVVRLALVDVQLIAW